MDDEDTPQADAPQVVRIHDAADHQDSASRLFETAHALERLAWLWFEDETAKQAHRRALERAPRSHVRHSTRCRESGPHGRTRHARVPTSGAPRSKAYFSMTSWPPCG